MFGLQKHDKERMEERSFTLLFFLHSIKEIILQHQVEIVGSYFKRAEIVLIPERAIKMVSCLGKIHNLPRTIKTKFQLAGCGFFPFRLSSSVLPCPPCLLCGSAGHTITPIVCLVFNHTGKLLYSVHLRSDCSFTCETWLVNKSHATHEEARLLGMVLVMCSPARLEILAAARSPN